MPRAATELAPSLQHDGQRRHAAEGHDCEQTESRVHACRERRQRNACWREKIADVAPRWVAALAGGRAPAASLASYSAFPHTRPTERLTPFLPSVPSLLPFFLIRGRRSASHFLTSVLPFLLKLRLGISKLVGESVFSHSVTHAERSSSGGY